MVIQKLAKANELRSQTTKRAFWYGRKLGCESKGVWNTEHGHNFGTQKFENRRMTCKTLCVFSGNGSVKRSMDMGSIETSWV